MSGSLQLQSCTAAASCRTQSPSCITICGAGMARWPPATRRQPGSPSILTHIRHSTNHGRPRQRRPLSDTPKPLKSCSCLVIQSWRDVPVPVMKVYKPVSLDLTTLKSLYRFHLILYCYWKFVCNTPHLWLLEVCQFWPLLDTGRSTQPWISCFTCIHHLLCHSLSVVAGYFETSLGCSLYILIFCCPALLCGQYRS